MHDSQSISVIIPALDERARIAATLTSLADRRVDVIVADGGSRDGTREIIRGFDSVRLIECERAGRGAQMNVGAAAAQGGILLFLHADAKLPDDAFERIAGAMSDERIVGGCFQIRFPRQSARQSGRSLHLVAWGINLRTRWFRTATGDQGVFVRRAVFDAIGGYREIPLMEDIALFDEMKRRGRVAILPSQIEISPRRWQRHGVWRTVLLMYALRLGYWMGIEPATLKRFFLDVR
jgi:rSAM/selenodomain-associated transferase 2